MSDEIEKIRELAAAGRVEWSDAGKRYFARAGVIKGDGTADFSVVDVNAEFWGPSDHNRGGVEIHWTTVSAGFGALTIFVDSGGKLKAQTEAMDKKFCMIVLAKLVEQMEIE